MKLAVSSVAVVILFCFVAGPASSKTLFFDDFDDNKLNPNYLTQHDQKEIGVTLAEWVEEDNILKEIEPVPGDPAYCVLTNQNFPASIGLQIKVRIDEWQDHNRSRVGLAVWLDKDAFYAGYTFVFYNKLKGGGHAGGGNIQFLNDHRAWDITKKDFEGEVGK